MSANLLDGVSPVLIKGVSLGADGELSFSTYAGSYDERQLVYELPFVGKLDANQTFYFGVSAIADGGTSTLFVKLSYADSAGNTNMAVAKIVVTATYARHETSLVIPSGMTIKDLLLSRGANERFIKIQPPTLSYGSPIVLAIASSTLAWSAGILATVRYYQLAAPTAATPTVPTSSSSLGSWTETEPTADVTKVLWTCERTVYADGTESWSKASKSTSYEAAKDAKSTATGAADAASRAISRMAMATCDTAQDVAAKVATVASGTFSLSTGACVQVVFSAANVALSPTLDVGGTGAKPIMTNGTPYAYWVAGAAVSFVYDGTCWQTCSVPVYASTVTVGNPAGRNIYIDSDRLDIRSGSTVMADFQSDVIHLGKNSTSSKVTFAGGVGNIWQHGSSMRLGSDKGVYLQVGSSDTGDDRGMGFLPDGDGTAACVRSESFVYNTRNVYAGTVLFDGDANGSVTLSESCANFDYIDIMYEVEDASEGAIWGSKRVSSPNGKQVGLEVVIAIRQGGAGTNPNAIQLQTRNYRFNGKSLAPFSAALMNYYSDGRLEFSGTVAQIHVRHVIGWKK